MPPKTSSKPRGPEEVTTLVANDDAGETAVIGRGKTGVNVMRAALLEKGIKPVHVGGSLPLLPFDLDHDAGKAYLVRFLGIERPSEDSEFDLIQFDVLDFEKFDPKAPESPEPLLYKAQLVAGTALRKWSGETAKPATVDPKTGQTEKPAQAATQGDAQKGDIVLLTYGGSTPTKRGRDPLKLFSVELVYRAKTK